MERWIEVLKGQIPKGNYNISYFSGEEGYTVKLTDQSNQIDVEIDFGIVYALQILDKESFVKSLDKNACNEFMKDNFSNVIYKVENGCFYKKINENSSELLDFIGLTHYVVIGLKSVIESLTYEIEHITILER